MPGKRYFVCCYPKQAGDRKKEEKKTRNEKVLCLRQHFSGGIFGARCPIMFYKDDGEFWEGLKNGWNSSWSVVHFILTSNIPNVLNFLKEDFFLLQFINASKCGCMGVWQTIPNFPSGKYSLTLTVLVLHLIFVWESSAHSAFLPLNSLSPDELMDSHGFDCCLRPSFYTRHYHFNYSLVPYLNWG